MKEERTNTLLKCIFDRYYRLEIMRKVLFFLGSFLLFSNLVVAQILKFKELTDLAKCKQYECFNDFVITKGFSFYKSEQSTLKDKIYTYASTEEFRNIGTANSLIKNLVEVTFRHNNSIIINYSTAVKEQYAGLLAQIKEAGFEAFKMENERNRVRAYYFSSKTKGYQVVVSESVPRKKGNKKYLNLYQIQILKNMEEYRFL